LQRHGRAHQAGVVRRALGLLDGWRRRRLFDRLLLDHEVDRRLHRDRGWLAVDLRRIEHVLQRGRDRRLVEAVADVIDHVDRGHRAGGVDVDADLHLRLLAGGESGGRVLGRDRLQELRRLGHLRLVRRRRRGVAARALGLGLRDGGRQRAERERRGGPPDHGP
jgi:hypothetical protein